MKILSAEGIKIIENKHITKENISSLALMEKASTAFVNIFIQKFLQKTPVFIFCGPGNNGGDGLVIGRLLKQLNYDINIYALNASKYSSEFIENKNTLEKISSITILKDFIDFPDIPKQAVVIDALFGIGLNKPLHGLSLQLVNHINKSEAKKVAVDIPSGLFSDKTNIKDVILQADVTITFQSPKLSFMFPENTKYVGELVIADLEISDDLINEIPCLHFYSTIKKIKPKIKKREKDGHKGTYGRALIIGGNYGMIGAPALAMSLNVVILSSKL